MMIVLLEPQTVKMIVLLEPQTVKDRFLYRHSADYKNRFIIISCIGYREIQVLVFTCIYMFVVEFFRI